MEQLKRIGGICRQHYEKIVLVLVLLLMAAAAVVIYGKSQEQRKIIQEIPVGFERQKVKGVKPVDLSRVDQAIQGASSPPAVVLGGKHNLFNPVRWVQYPGQPIKKVETGQEVGPGQMLVEKIRPLNLTIAFDKAGTSGTGDQRVVTGYHTVITNDVAPPARRRVSQFMGVGDTNKQMFVIMAVNGPADTPTELVARLKEFGGETISFGPGKPYVRAVGYEADLKYKVTGASFPRLRVGATLTVDGDAYKIVDITENAVVMSDQSNGQRYTVGTSTPP